MFLFLTLIIYPPSSPSKSFFFQLVISDSFFLSYNSLNLLTPLLIFAHFLSIVWLWVGVIFVDVDLFPRLFGFVLEYLYITIEDVVSNVTLSQPGRGKNPPRMAQQQLKPNYNQKAHMHGIKGIPRVSSPGDQGACTTESHRPPTTEGHTTKAGSQSRSI